MFPPGFFGTNADLLMDLVIVAFIIIIPALIISWRMARKNDHVAHSKLQLTLGIILGVAVAIFEVDLSMAGGMAELTKDSAYFGTPTLNNWMYGHTIVAILTTLFWLVLIVMSMKKFKFPPKSNAFKKIHKPVGIISMLLMFATGLSSFPLYYYGFMN